ncbi:MAG: histidine--tRNA ligase [Nitrospirota bacterium]
MAKIRAIKGVKDILPGEVEIWQHIEKTARDIFEISGFGEIKIPVFESTELFSRSIGEGTDIVEKEMYTFEDRDGKKITLRPEGTASVARSYIEHHLHIKQPVTKLYYIGPMFRHERPQAGRFRQFYQIGGEVIGIASPYIDVEILAILYHLFNTLKIENIEIEINSLGCKICRPDYKERLKNFIKDRLDSLCESCKRRYHTNPIRILDCKREGCISSTDNAPSPIDHLCEECSSHFEMVMDRISALHIPVNINHRLVRGLDYYTRTSFEIVSNNRLGAQNAVAAGGRYDGLIEELGGQSTPAIGFAIGIERLSYLIDKNTVKFPVTDLYMAVLGQKAKKEIFPLYTRMQQRGIRVEIDYGENSLRNQMKKADKSGAPLVLIIGEKELKEGDCTLRDMVTKHQEKIPINNLIDKIVERVKLSYNESDRRDIY